MRAGNALARPISRRYPVDGILYDTGKLLPVFEMPYSCSSSHRRQRTSGVRYNFPAQYLDNRVLVFHQLIVVCRRTLCSWLSVVLLVFFMKPDDRSLDFDG